MRGIYSTRTQIRKERIKYPAFVFWKKWELKDAITTSDEVLVKIDTVLFLDRIDEIYRNKTIFSCSISKRYARGVPHIECGGEQYKRCLYDL